MEVSEKNVLTFNEASEYTGMSKSTLYKARKKLAALSQKYNCIDWGQFISKRVIKKWFNLAQFKQKNRRHFPRLLKALQAGKKATFSNLEYMLENVTIGDVKKRKEKREKITPKKTLCHCVVCGRLLVDQKQGSRFCSEKIYGKEARICRNKDSNRRLAIKRKIKRAMENEKMLRITYESEGKEYSDILGAHEVNVTREWLDKVKSVEVLDSPPLKLKGVEAKKYLQTIKNK